MKKAESVRNLYPGDLFGEVAFVYGVIRSCSITSTNYTTLG